MFALHFAGLGPEFGEGALAAVTFDDVVLSA
jgi:hypothetical protein